MDNAEHGTENILRPGCFSPCSQQRWVLLRPAYSCSPERIFLVTSERGVIITRSDLGTNIPILSPVISFPCTPFYFFFLIDCLLDSVNSCKHQTLCRGLAFRRSRASPQAAPSQAKETKKAHYKSEITITQSHPIDPISFSLSCPSLAARSSSLTKALPTSVPSAHLGSHLIMLITPLNCSYSFPLASSGGLVQAPGIKATDIVWTCVASYTGQNERTMLNHISVSETLNGVLA